MSSRQFDQKHVSSEIALMEWSPTMDLIALATINGEVVLHRLSWQKVWSVSSPGKKEKPVKVTALAWRPDGKVLAFSYDTGKLVLCDVENSETMHSFEVSDQATSLTWVGKKLPPAENKSTVFYHDRSTHFLPKLHSLSKSYGSANKQVDENIDDSKKLKGQDELNILVVGTNLGKINLYCFGIFLCGIIDLKNNLPSSYSPIEVLSVALSEDLSVLSVVVKTKDCMDFYTHHLLSFNVPILKEKTEELKVIALKYGQIYSLLAYLALTIRAISEAWEDILLEIDSKLMNYAEEKKRTSGGTISDDFLELLIFGTPSDSLEKFLLHDLTEKGLKKLGHSIELSYSNIQKLVLKHLQSVSSSLYYHLSDLKGMAAWQERFENLGLSLSVVSQAVFSVGSFLLKATEIQQVIDSSMKNFKAFFRWLYAVILRLSEEPVPAEIMKVTQQDLNFVAEFLKENFTCEWDQEKKTSFKLERVGQYLKMEDLSFPPTITSNPWVKFLNDHLCIKESNMIFPYHPEKSLVQQHSDLCKMVETAFNGPSKVFEKYVTVRNRQILFASPHDQLPKISHSSSVKSGFIYNTYIPCSPHMALFITRESLSEEKKIEAVCLSFEDIHNPTYDLNTASCSKTLCKHNILDGKFYNDETISILLSEGQSSQAECSSPAFMQLSLKGLYSEMKTIANCYPLNFASNTTVLKGGLFVDKTTSKRMENMNALSIAVSGSRKVSCVLMTSRRQLRIFEMDVDDEEEDQEDTEHDDSGLKDSSDKGHVLGKFNESLLECVEDIKENSF